MLTLYFSPGACSTASHIGIEECGATYTEHPVLIAKGEQKTPEYAKINPRGKVPALAPPRRERADGTMEIDPATRRNLELVKSLDGRREGSLLATIDRTREEFHISGRHLETAVFPTASGKAAFHVVSLPSPPEDGSYPSPSPRQCIPVYQNSPARGFGPPDCKFHPAESLTNYFPSQQHLHR